MKNDLISIIVPVYNVEKYLSKCLDSIINQLYKNIEIILINDGSTDNSKKICEEYVMKDNRITLINTKNSGQSAARNVGINAAKGKYIGFVDSDDYIEPSMFQYLYNLIKDNKADISICNYLYCTENSNLNLLEQKDYVLEFTKKEALAKLLKGDMIQDFVWNKLYRKELFKDNLFVEGKKMEDIGIMYKLFNKADKIVLGNSIQYYYLQRSSSTMGNRNFNLYKDLYELSLERYEFISEHYPDIQECYIDMLNKIITIYKVKDKEVYNYFVEENMFDKYKMIYKKINFSKINIRLAFKFFLFKNFRFVFKI